MVNETRSTKQDEVKDVAEDEPFIEYEMECHNKKKEKDIHQVGMVNRFTLLKKKILLL